MSRRKSGSLLYQVSKRMDALNRIGESKHQAKKDYRAHCEKNGIIWNPAKATGIFSYNTFNAYKQTSADFTNWVKEHHPEIKNINAIEKEYAIRYLQENRDQGKSAWSLSRDMSGLNKVFDFGVTKKEADLPERSYKNSHRSRLQRDHDGSYNPKNYEKQIDFAKAFGVRRESIVGGQYQVKDISLFRRDEKIYVSVIEKGGRYREAPCLQSMQSAIEKHFPEITERDSLTKTEFEKLYNSSEDHLFDRYTQKIDNHAFRHEYARNFYTQSLQELQQSTPDREFVLERGFDREALGLVSFALGHSIERTSIVLEYYLR